MKYVAVSEREPVIPTNGGSLRFWHLCDQGEFPCFYIHPPAQPFQAEYGILQWKSLQRCSQPALIDICREVQKQGGKVFVQGLQFALRLKDCGLTADYVDVVDSMAVYFIRRSKYLRWSHPIKAINSIIQALPYVVKEKTARRIGWTILAAAEADAGRFRGGAACVIAAPNGTAWLGSPSLYVPRAEAKTLGFHGGMTWDPNVTAVEYVAREVMPLVLRKVPIAKFRIIGGPIIPRIEALRLLPGIEIIGPVVDMREALSELDLYVMPMVQGSGVKNKLMEAMAAGLPVVTNTRGAEAFFPLIASSVETGETALELAEKICSLLRSNERRANLSCCARAFATEHFSLRSMPEWVNFAQQGDKC